MLEGRGQAGRIRLVPRQVLALASAEIRDRYLGSVLGLLWAIIHPLVLILLYVFVFSVVLKVKIGGEGDAEEYGLFLFAGIIPWRMVQDILIRAPGTYLERANLLEKIPMSPLVVPMSLVLVCLFNLVVDLSVFVTVLLVLGRSLAPLVILLLPLTIGTRPSSKSMATQLARASAILPDGMSCPATLGASASAGISMAMSMGGAKWAAGSVPQTASRRPAVPPTEASGNRSWRGSLSQSSLRGASARRDQPLATMASRSS